MEDTPNPGLLGVQLTAKQTIELLRKPFADYEGDIERNRRHSLALEKIIQQNEMILIVLGSTMWR